jgi:hypothetical protein
MLGKELYQSKGALQMKIRERKTIVNFKPNEHQIRLLEYLTKNDDSHRLALRQSVGLSERWFQVNMDPLVEQEAVDHEERGPYNITAIGRVLLMTERAVELTRQDLDVQKRKDFRRVWSELQKVHKKAFRFGPQTTIDFGVKGKPCFKEFNLPEKFTLPDGRHLDHNLFWVMAFKTKDGEPRIIVKIPTVEEMREQGFDV